jgi:DNA-binding IclR family transcriptional regulator
MRVTAPFQNEILNLLLRYGKPMSLRQITQSCSLTYHQVASCLIALKSKGYVRKVKTGVYEVTENAKLEELSPETQIKILKGKISELENLISTLLLRNKRLN